jgi:hypothetical protein
MTTESDRRGFMKTVGAGGLAVAAGGAAIAAAPAVKGRTMMLPPIEGWLNLKPDARGIVRFSVDVAVLGHTDAIDPSGRIGPKDSQKYFEIDVRGDTFYVEGALYPGGTIPEPTVETEVRPGRKSRHYQQVWDFTKAPPVGHWLSRGWAIINGHAEYKDTRGTVVERARTEPHLLTEHNYVFGRMTGDNLTPEMLISSGADDGNDPEKEVLVRAITGGTGRFRFARGQVIERRVGRNTTVLRSFSNFPNAYSPNYRFEFELKLD